jgi:hypothetical protein
MLRGLFINYYLIGDNNLSYTSAEARAEVDKKIENGKFLFPISSNS